MSLFIVRSDITTMKVDAIVNAANESLLGGGGVDGAIHRAAGPELLAECRTLGGCKTGQAKLTKGYRLSARFVIHTVGPVWRGGGHGERELLVSAYRSSLEVALAHRCGTVAFPLISAGVYGYPKDQAIRVAVDTIGDFLLSHDEMTVYLVIFNRTAFTIDHALFADIASYIDGRFAPAAPDESRGEPDEGFSRMLLRKMDEKGLTGAQCCKRANVHGGLFSRLCSDACFRPSKSAAMAFAIALELPLEQARELLEKAGFAFSRGSKRDLIVEYFITRGRCNIFQVNEALFAFDQDLLGG